MSGLFGGGKSTSTVAEKLAGIQIQTSAYGGAIPIVYGTNRVPANLLDYDDFTAIPHTTTTRAGKGGGGGTMSNTTYSYTAMVILGICEGPAGIGRVWRDKEVGSLSGYGLTMFAGARSQAPWSYLTSKHPTKAVGYAGTCLVAHSAMDLGDSATVKNHSFEVTGFCAIAYGSAGYPDANAADIVPHLLTDPYVSPGWSSAKLGDLTVYRTYCTAAGFWISPVINEQKPAREWLQTILDATNAEAVWAQGSGGMALKIIPYGDTPITANGATYTPNTTPLYDLGPDDFVVEGPKDKPVKIKRKSTADTFNCVPVEFRDRAIDYNTNVLDDPEPVDTDAFGPRKGETRTLHCIARSSHALQISRILAQRSIKCRNEYEFRLGWRYSLLEPMDLVTLTEPTIGFDHVVVRIKEVSEDEKGKLTLIAEEWPFGTASPTAYTPQSGDGNAPNVNADPGDANAPTIFDAPILLAESGGPEVWLATSGGSLWGGCEVWVSTDGGGSYSLQGGVSQPARHGTLTAGLGASASALDTTNTLAVQLAQTSQQMVSASAQDRDDLVTAVWAGGEVLAYQTATLTGPGAYNLTSLRRGAYGTSMGAKANGSSFARLDAAIFKLPIEASRLGTAIRVKLVSFNVWGAGKQDISAVPYYTFTPAAQAAPAPYNVTLSVSASRPS